MKTISRIEKETRRRTVLVVDDEMINRMLLGHILSDEFEILYAENGREALDIIKREHKVLSIVLLDLLMPEMDGYEVIGVMQNDSKLRNIPVIVLTSEKSAEIHSLQLGAVDFIPKPYDLPEVVIARIKRSIKLAEENNLLTAVENDKITGLYNKEFFYQYAEQQDDFHSGVEMDMIVLNINRFHIVNELYGHQVGNELLRIVADLIRELLQTNIGLACRCDSDLFYVYLAHQNNPGELFDKIDKEIEKRSGLHGLSVRMGIYECCDKTLSLDQRIDRAARACNKCRDTYSSSFAVYDKELNEKELFGEKLILEIDNALAENQFQVFYQPKYDIVGDTPVIASAEALIRWKHPEFGMISPGVFIPLFEENGLIQKLDNFVWNEAARQISEWKRELGVSFPVSVNVSRIDVFDPELEENLKDIVRRNGLEENELMLEITESAYSESSKGMIEMIDRLRADGFIIEMDDFGSGYSSLNMLTTLSIDILKLDMGFVRKMCCSEKDRRMVEFILEIARFLGLPVVAEGVETKEQYHTLKEMGCNIIQGYYFSKPVPPDIMRSKIVNKVPEK